MHLWGEEGNSRGGGTPRVFFSVARLDLIEAMVSIPPLFLCQQLQAAQAERFTGPTGLQLQSTGQRRAKGERHRFNANTFLNESGHSTGTEFSQASH
jgi:hypothetical protein